MPKRTHFFLGISVILFFSLPFFSKGVPDRSDTVLILSAAQSEYNFTINAGVNVIEDIPQKPLTFRFLEWIGLVSLIDVFDEDVWQSYQDQGYTVKVGDILHYKVVFSNVGLSRVDKVSLVATLPAGTALFNEAIAIQPSKYDYSLSNQQIIIPVKHFKPDDSVTLYYKVRVTGKATMILQDSFISVKDTEVLHHPILVNYVSGFSDTSSISREDCFSKQFLQDLVYLPENEGVTVEVVDQFTQVFSGSSADYNLYLEYYEDSFIQEDFLLDVLSLPCVSVSDQYLIEYYPNSIELSLLVDSQLISPEAVTSETSSTSDATISIVDAVEVVTETSSTSDATISIVDAVEVVTETSSTSDASIVESVDIMTEISSTPDSSINNP